MGYDPNGPNNPYQNTPWPRTPGNAGNEGYQQYPGYPGPGAQAHEYPAGLALYDIDIGVVMRQVYVWLTFGLAVGFGISYVLGRALQNDIATYRATGEVSGLIMLFLSPVAWIVSLAGWIVIGFGFYPIVQRASVIVSAVLYLIFAAIFGFWTSLLFLEYTGNSIAVAFVATTAMFAVTSVIGYITNADLSRFGPILLMALIGLLIASLVNLFVHNSTLYWVISYAGVVLFTALTAYDTQWIKKRASAAASSGKPDSEERVALMGAFKLFLDFVNLFLFVVRIQGRSR
jgi:FtsH-binding integral membrane protein